MRGSKPFWIFSVYVFCLCLIGMVMYVSILGRSGLSLAGAQSELTNFFSSLMALLAGAICVISPALTGTAIVAERQRQSLDLVLSAPVEPKYLLVGKMISSYRYTWMLLILALPVVAMSVVLGGATWQDVFGCFLLLSFHALIFTSLALMISTMTNKPASAVIWSFFAVFAYVIAMTFLSSTALSRAFAGSASHVPFTIALTPFFALQAINSSTQIGSIDVPNWVFAAVLALLLTRLFLLGAAVNLAPLDKRLSANLRLSGLVYTFGLGALVMYSMAPMFMMMSGSMSAGGMTPSPPGLDPDLMVLNIGLASVAWLLFGMPMLSCYGWEGSRRFWPNGIFSLRRALDGTPAGNLPYLLVLIASGIGGSLCGNIWAGGTGPKGSLLPGLLWPAGLIVLAWSIGRLLSAACKAMKTARAFHLCVLILLVGAVPLAMLIFQLSPSWSVDPESHTSAIWSLWLFTPLLTHDLFKLAWVYGVIMLGIGLLLAFWAQVLEAKRPRGNAVA